MKEKQHIDVIFPFLLLCIFMISGAILIGYYAIDVQNLRHQADTEEQLTISLAYMKNKVQQAEEISITRQEEITCLMLSETQQDIPYMTYIYVFDGFLRELFIQEGLPIRLENGTKIAEMDTAAFDLQEHLLNILLTHSQKAQKGMTVYIEGR